MTVEDATNIIVGACRALHYVHSKGYVHADISTDNFFAFRNPDNVSSCMLLYYIILFRSASIWLARLRGNVARRYMDVYLLKQASIEKP